MNLLLRFHYLALAETMLFVEINWLYARKSSSDVINFIEATEIEDDVSSDDDIPFELGVVAMAKKQKAKTRNETKKCRVE